jgi:hypothetical protein
MRVIIAQWLYQIPCAKHPCRMLELSGFTFKDPINRLEMLPILRDSAFNRGRE